MDWWSPGLAVRGAATLAAVAYYLRATALQAQQLMRGHLEALSYVLFYGFLLLLFIIRTPAKTISIRWLHWLVVLAGSLIPLLTQPAAALTPWLLWAAWPLQLAGLLVCVAALSTLGRSFGMIAAVRDIKTGGLYGLVRHPLYAGESLWYGSIILMSPSAFNVGLFLTHTLLQLVRLLEEERLLSQDRRYAEYMRRVRYRLIPGLF